MDKPEPSPIKAISRVSITDSVVDRIREMIESGAYEVGEKLPTEAKLCEMLSVSRTSVREATRVLQTLGYVTLVPGKGAFVADLKPSDGGEENWFDVENVQFYDFMEVRMAIETLAVRLSVERATPKQIRALEKIHAAFLEANENRTASSSSCWTSNSTPRSSSTPTIPCSSTSTSSFWSASGSTGAAPS